MDKTKISLIFAISLITNNGSPIVLLNIFFLLSFVILLILFKFSTLLLSMFELSLIVDNLFGLIFFILLTISRG